MRDGVIELRNGHNHEPDLRQSQRLNTKMAVLNAGSLSFLRAESFPTEIRATACGYVVALGKVLLALNEKFFPIAIASFGFLNVVYYYALIMTIMVIWGCLTIKDTEELSLTEIHDISRNDESKQEEEEKMLLQPVEKKMHRKHRPILVQ